MTRRRSRGVVGRPAGVPIGLRHQSRNLRADDFSEKIGAALILASVPNRGKDRSRRLGMEDRSMTAYVLVIVLAAGGHHQSVAVGYPDQGSCLVAAERLRHKKRLMSNA
jgi:hypothetical protein